MDSIRSWFIARGRQARQQVRRVSEQAVAKARQAGRAAATRVRAVQRAAGLPDKLIRRSVQSVATREPSRPSDAAWKEGYLQVAAPREPDGPLPLAGPEPPGPRPGPAPPADRPVRYAPEPRAGASFRMPPGHGRRIARGDFATPNEAREAADAWRDGTAYADYLAMGTGDREAGQ